VGSPIWFRRLETSAALAPGATFISAPAGKAISRSSILIAADVPGSTMTISRGPKARGSNAVGTRADEGKAKLPNPNFRKTSESSRLRIRTAGERPDNVEA
jgi:hypothetical protein